MGARTEWLAAIGKPMVAGGLVCLLTAFGGGAGIEPNDILRARWAETLQVAAPVQAAIEKCLQSTHYDLRSCNTNALLTGVDAPPTGVATAWIAAMPPVPTEYGATAITVGGAAGEGAAGTVTLAITGGYRLGGCEVILTATAGVGGPLTWTASNGSGCTRINTGVGK